MESNKKRRKATDKPSRERTPMYVDSYVDELRLTPFEFRLLAHIIRRTGSKPGGKYWVPTAKAAEACQMSESKVRESLRFLEEAGFIKKIKEEPGSSKVYVLQEHEHWPNGSKRVEEIRQEIKQKKSNINYSSINKKTQNKDEGLEEF